MNDEERKGELANRSILNLSYFALGFGVGFLLATLVLHAALLQAG